MKKLLPLCVLVLGFGVCQAQANDGPLTGLPGEASRSAATEIPEPSTLGLLGAGLVAVAVSLGRRARARSTVT